MRDESWKSCSEKCFDHVRLERQDTGYAKKSIRRKYTSMCRNKRSFGRRRFGVEETIRKAQTDSSFGGGRMTPSPTLNNKTILWQGQSFPVTEEVAERIEHARSANWREALMYLVIMRYLCNL